MSFIPVNMPHRLNCILSCQHFVHLTSPLVRNAAKRQPNDKDNHSCKTKQITITMLTIRMLAMYDSILAF